MVFRCHVKYMCCTRKFGIRWWNLVEVKFKLSRTGNCIGISSQENLSRIYIISCVKRIFWHRKSWCERPLYFPLASLRTRPKTIFHSPLFTQCRECRSPTLVLYFLCSYHWMVLISALATWGLRSQLHLWYFSTFSKEPSAIQKWVLFGRFCDNSYNRTTPKDAS